MGIVLDFAILGLALFIIVTLAYSLALLILAAAYSLLAHGNLSTIKSHYFKLFASAAVASGLNNLTISIIILKVLFDALGPGIPTYAPFGAAGGALALGIIALAVTSKIIGLAILSLAFWLAASCAIFAYLVKRKAGTGEGRRAIQARRERRPKTARRKSRGR
ncbi:MAG: hypothetical protein ABH863_06445 [Candidatus Micrarchaeota archaeon]